MVRFLVALLAVLIAPTAFADDPFDVFDVKFSLELDPRDTVPVEGEMVLATLRGQYRETITNEEVKLRRMTDFDWIQLAPDRWTEQRIDGLPTVVLERRIALFAKRAGELTILPIAHELEVMNRSSQRQIILVRSAPVTLEVVAKPAGVGSEWLPVRAIEMSETWSLDPAKLVDGQNVERRVVLRALGAPPELLPKQPAMREPWLITFTPPEERSVQITKQGPVSTVVWVWRLRPITGEPGVIPEVSIPYFDTTDQQAKTVIIPPAPIGYASFANNDSAGWQSGFTPNATLILGFLIGLFAALLASLRGLRLKRAPFSGLKAWFARRRRFAELRRFERQGDVSGFRGCMAEFLRLETSLDEAERLALTKRLDAMIFAVDPPQLTNELSEARRVLRNL